MWFIFVSVCNLNLYTNTYFKKCGKILCNYPKILKMFKSHWMHSSNAQSKGVFRVRDRIKKAIQNKMVVDVWLHLKSSCCILRLFRWIIGCGWEWTTITLVWNRVRFITRLSNFEFWKNKHRWLWNIENGEWLTRQPASFMFVSCNW